MFRYFVISLILLPVLSYAALPTQTSVSNHGITWTFSEAVPVGQFVNGDYYVVGNFTITKIDPSPTSNRNGSVLNIPMDSGISGFDDRTPGSRFRSNIRANLPISMKPGDALISSISVTTMNTIPNMLRSEDKAISPVKTKSILTCLAQEVSADAFRPSYADRGQKIFYGNNLRRSLLPNISSFTDLTVLNEFIGYFERPWVDVCFFSFDASADYQPQYAREIGRAAGMATLRLMLDYPQIEKDKLLYGFVQYGIDLWGMIRAGYRGWPAHGGHGTGRKWPIVFAGIMLDDTDMMSPTKKYPNVEFGEDQQTMYDNGWTGATVVYAGHKGVDKNGTPISTDPAWQPYEHEHPSKWVDKVGESYRRCCTSIAWIGMALSGRILRAESQWDHNAFFDYADRWMTEDDFTYIQEIKTAKGWDYSDSPQRRTWDIFVNFMWLLYRNNLPALAVSNYEPIKSHHGTPPIFSPNPFSTGTRIDGWNSSPISKSQLRIFSSEGTSLFNREIPSGDFVFWDGNLEDGRPASSGIYFYELISGKNKSAGTLLKIEK